MSKRALLAGLVLVLLALVGLFVFMAYPVVRYAQRAEEDSSLRRAETERLAVPPLAFVPQNVPQVDAGSACLEGVVLSSDLTPAPNVAVTTAANPTRTPDVCGEDFDCPAHVEMVLDGGTTFYATPDLKGTTTDAAGRFRFCQLEPGDRLVWAEGVKDTAALAILTWPSAESVRLVLRASAKLTGRVFDSAQRDIPNATLVIVSGVGATQQTLTSDARGRFEARVPNERFSIWARAEGFVPRHLLFRADELQAIAVQLEPAGALIVTVVDDG